MGCSAPKAKIQQLRSIHIKSVGTFILPRFYFMEMRFSQWFYVLSLTLQKHIQYINLIQIFSKVLPLLNCNSIFNCIMVI